MIKGKNALFNFKDDENRKFYYMYFLSVISRSETKVLPWWYWWYKTAIEFYDRVLFCD